jgi:hypothetical protein
MARTKLEDPLPVIAWEEPDIIDGPALNPPGSRKRKTPEEKEVEEEGQEEEPPKRPRYQWPLGNPNAAAADDASTRDEEGISSSGEWRLWQNPLHGDVTEETPPAHPTRLKLQSITRHCAECYRHDVMTVGRPLVPFCDMKCRDKYWEWL